MEPDKKVNKETHWSVYVLIPIVAILIFKHFFPYFRVVSNSMEPTIYKSAYAITSRYAYRNESINRGDIVVFKPSSKIFNRGAWMHRIIAVEDDKVIIENGLVYVNNELAQFKNLIHKKSVSIIVPEGYIFQKGDNEDTIYGLVPKKDIIGKVIWHN